MQSIPYIIINSETPSTDYSSHNAGEQQQNDLKPAYLEEQPGCHPFSHFYNPKDMLVELSIHDSRVYYVSSHMASICSQKML